MGKIKYIKKIKDFFKDSPVVSIGSLKKFLGKTKNDYIYLIINNLLKKGEIKRITKGYYTVYEDPSLAVFCFKPAYLGLQDALSQHDLWEQETIPIIITTRKIRQGIRKVFGVNILVRRMNRRYFFGFDYEKQGDFYYPYSDMEKTFIDMVYFRQHLDTETRKEFKKRLDKKRLEEYLKKYPLKIRNMAYSYLK
ncbi:MAG: hypothetical protein AABX50_01060 [Nanoarchaeota archaeon]